MNTQKIFTYVALVLGVVGLISQVMILSKGDDAIKLNASLYGEYGVVSFMVYFAIFVLSITVILTLFFSFANLASEWDDTKKLIKALISIGAFAVIAIFETVFSWVCITPSAV